MIQFDWSEQIQDWVFKTWRENQGAGVKIAVLDSGVDIEHPALKRLDQTGHKINVAAPGFDPKRLELFSNGDVSDKYQEKGHGTQCASTLAASPEDKNELRGVAPKAEIFIIKVCTLENKFFLAKDYLKGLEAAALLEVDLVISSICFPKEDLEAERISPAEIDRVLGLLDSSGAFLLASLPNRSHAATWKGLADKHFPNYWEKAVNVGAISKPIFIRRKEEIVAEPKIHFLASDAIGFFCKIQQEYEERRITSSFGVYLIAAVAALYLSSEKKRYRGDYQAPPLPEFLLKLSRLFQSLGESETWDDTQPVLYKTNATVA